MFAGGTCISMGNLAERYLGLDALNRQEYILGVLLDPNAEIEAESNRSDSWC